MPKAKWLDRTLVTSPHYLCLCTDKKQFKKCMQHLKVKKHARPLFVPVGANAVTHFFESGGKQVAVIGIHRAPDKTTAEIYALLVHEAAHVWQAIVAEINETAPSSEFMAYGLQHISQRLFEAYVEQKGA